MGSNEYREALLEEKVRDLDEEEDCPGCKIEKLKHFNHGIPYKHLLYVFFIALSAGLPISSLFPFLYFMIRDFHIAERDEDIGYYAGFLGSAFMFGRFSTSVIWGIIADRYGRKPVIMFGMVTMIILNTLFGLSTNFWMAIGTRFLLGSLCGILGPLRAYASEICRKEYQALALSVMSTSWGLGLVIGPAIGGFLSQPADKFPNLITRESFFGRFPYSLPCLMISAFTLGVTLFCTWLPETIHFHPKMNEQQGEEILNLIESASNGSDQKEFQQSLFKNWPLMSAIIIYCVFQLHEMAYAEIFPLWALSPKKYGGLSYSTSDVGEVLATSGMGMLVFQLFVYPPLERFFGPVVLARIGALLTISLLSSYPFIAKLSGTTQALVINFAALMKNVIAISITTGLFLLQNRAVRQRQRGAANGIAMSAVSLFKAFGPALGGFLFSWAQKRSNASFLPGNHMIFFMLNVCEVLALIMTFKPFLVAARDNVL